MWFGILGPLDVRSAAGEVLPVGGPRVCSLLVLLLLDAGRLVGTERLIDGLYGQDPPGGAANALQSQVSRLRRVLGDDGHLVEFHPAGYRLAVDPESVDAHRFERLARAGQQALAKADHSGATELLDAALALWRGPALAGVLVAGTRAARLEELRLAAVEDRAEAGLALGRHRGLPDELGAVVAAHPLRERSVGLFMRALHAGGRQAEALTAFEDARRTLAEELGADPCPELSAIHLALLRAAPHPVTAVRLGVPVQLTSFVGREEELTRIGGLLAEGRLVTLTGPGGAGKTRSAIEAAGRQADDACFVDLAPLGDGAEVPQAVLGALGLRETGLLPSAGGPQPDAADRLVAALTGRRMLLILDNCEHVVEAAARLAGRLLTACPGLRILATSREALGITGESLCPMRSLALPAPGSGPVEALGSAAVRLFTDRAAAVRPGFAIDGSNVEAVRRICEALDGQPLAIELAAARLRSLTAADVAARLGADDRFRLLSRGDRGAAPRHQTLRAVVEWSWDLLDGPEQMLARRLTVFAGGVTLEAAGRVCGLPDDEVVELLTGLADKSLVEDTGGRYRMLDTIGVFCAERLAEAGERDRLQSAHATYFLDLAEAADSHLLRAEQLEWLARLSSEHANLLAALRYCVQTDPVGALRLLAALSSYWWLRGMRSEGAPLARTLLDAIGPEAPAGLEEEYVLCMLSAASGGSQDAGLRARLWSAEPVLRSTSGHLRRPFLLVAWAMFSGPPGEDSPPGPPMELEDFAGLDPWVLALIHFGVGFGLWFSGGDAEAAEWEFNAALSGFRALGERWGTAQALDGLALIADHRGDRERSMALTDEALVLAGELGAIGDVADLLCGRADGSVRAGKLDEAWTGYERAAEAARRAGVPESLARAHQGLGEVTRLRGDLAGARALCETALADCVSEWFDAAETRARIWLTLGRIAEAEGDEDAARAWLGQVLPRVITARNLTMSAAVAECLAGMAVLGGEGELAATLLGAASALLGAYAITGPDAVRVSAAARRLIGDSVFEPAYGQGASMSHDEALTFLGSERSAIGA
jgi:predicted ATPase/DNA-binding SARP family transcriptional activator